MATEAAAVDFVARHLGMRVAGPAAARTRHAIKRAMDAVGVTVQDDFVGLLQRDTDLFERLVDAVTIDETYFFREPDQTETLRRTVLPDLRSGRTPGRGLRIWSAGCATGEEAYSLAFLLDREGLLESSRIFATDVSVTALETARSAVYGRWSLRSLDRADCAVRRLFDPAGNGRLRVPPRVAGQVDFAQLNLVSDPYPPAGFDLIVCRNVLLYMTEVARRRVARSLAASLAPGGWLLIASTDPTCGLGEVLEVIRTPAGSTYRRPGPTPLPTDPRRGPFSVEEAGFAHRGIVRPVTTEARRNERGAHEVYVREDAPVPGEPATVVKRATSLAAAGQVGEALAVIRNAIEGNPLTSDLRNLEAILLLENGEAELAMAAAMAATYISPGCPAGYMTRGRAELARGDRSAALRAFTTACELLGTIPDDTKVAVFDRKADELLLTATALVHQLSGQRS